MSQLRLSKRPLRLKTGGKQKHATSLPKEGRQPGKGRLKKFVGAYNV